jgi:hypothetical protein
VNTSRPCSGNLHGNSRLSNGACMTPECVVWWSTIMGRSLGTGQCGDYWSSWSVRAFTWPDRDQRHCIWARCGHLKGKTPPPPPPPLTIIREENNRFWFFVFSSKRLTIPTLWGQYRIQTAEGVGVKPPVLGGGNCTRL